MSDESRQDEQGQAQSQSVPYERFQRVIGERNDLKKSLEDALAKLKEIAEQQAAWERERAALVAARDEAARAALRLQVAARVGLPLALADRLRGDDEAAIERDAAQLLAALPKSAPPAAAVPPLPQGAGEVRLDALTPAQIRERAADLWRVYVK